MKKRKLLILLLPILFLACSLPPYNEKLSRALISTKKMKQEAVIGPLHMWKGEFEGVENDGKGNYWTEGYGWYELRNQDRTTLNYQVQTIKGGDFINVVIRSDFPLDLPADLENAFYYYYPDTSTGFISFFSASASAKIWVISTHRMEKSCIASPWAVFTLFMNYISMEYIGCSLPCHVGMISASPLLSTPFRPGILLLWISPRLLKMPLYQRLIKVFSSSNSLTMIGSS